MSGQCLFELAEAVVESSSPVIDLFLVTAYPFAIACS